RAPADLPSGRSLQFSAPFPTRNRGAHRHDHRRGTSPDPSPRDGGRGGDVRPARRRHPPGLRPDHRQPDPPHPRAPRAGGRPHGRGVRPRHGPARRVHGDGGPGGDQHRRAPGEAYMEAVPMVCITGQVPFSAIGTDAFQECDTVGITRSVTKHNELITSAQDIPLMVRQAFPLAPTGRPGPVLLDLPKDIVDPRNPRSQMEWYWPSDDEVAASLPGYRPTTKGHPKMIRQAAELLPQARKPVIHAGGGILKARAAEALRELAELCDIHVVTTLMARGAFPDDHRLALGMPGMHGNYTSVTSMQQTDRLIALGSRFDDRVTGKVPTFAPEAKIIHVDIDPAELGKVRRPDVPIVGDLRIVIEEMIKAVRELGGREAQPDRTKWKQTISGWQENFPLTY